MRVIAAFALYPNSTCRGTPRLGWSDIRNWLPPPVLIRLNVSSASSIQRSIPPGKRPISSSTEIAGRGREAGIHGHSLRGILPGPYTAGGEALRERSTAAGQWPYRRRGVASSRRRGLHVGRACHARNHRLANLAAHGGGR